MSAIANVIPLERIEHSILLLRGHKVMLSIELANLYQVEPRALIQAIKRNLNRFPGDFMFQLTAEEWENLKSQFVISSWGGVRTPPYAFTEQGVAMLSSVLNSDRAVQVNIEIMRAFVRLRQLLASNAVRFVFGKMCGRVADIFDVAHKRFIRLGNLLRITQNNWPFAICANYSRKHLQLFLHCQIPPVLFPAKQLALVGGKFRVSRNKVFTDTVHEALNKRKKAKDRASGVGRDILIEYRNHFVAAFCDCCGFQLAPKILKPCQRDLAFCEHEKRISQKKIIFNRSIAGVMTDANPSVVWHIV
jgi:hypothetical protein